MEKNFMKNLIKKNLVVLNDVVIKRIVISCVMSVNLNLNFYILFFDVLVMSYGELFWKLGYGWVVMCV